MNNTDTATQTRTSECTHCDKLTAQIVALEDTLLQVQATAADALPDYLRHDAVLNLARNIA